ncbi:MAG: hypothetical protein BWX74_00817 [Tenericutes bacterium ADurb.Bin087]|nr:MAG: hypothetical protein BWX74_00817 [Tenericutes bacterium ADurb.Bin087]
MKKPFAKLGLLLAVFGLLVGCDNSSSVAPQSSASEEPPVSSSEEVVLTEQEYQIAVNYIARSVPLVLERGVKVPTNVERAEAEVPLPTPELKYGDNLLLITAGELKYEDEINGVYLYPEYTVTYSYLEGEHYAGFEFEYDDIGRYFAVPGYPRYEAEYDGAGNPIHTVPPAKAARLYVTIHIDDRHTTFNMDMILEPQAIIHDYDLVEVRSVPTGSVVRVYGYFNGYFTDWNNGVLCDGDVALGLFKIQDFNYMELGKMYAVVGQFTVYNGLPQLQWIKTVSEVEPADHPTVREPETVLVGADDFADQLDIGNELSGPLMHKVGTTVQFSFPLRYKEILDRDGNPVEPSALELGKHADVVLVGKDSANLEFEVKLSLNYHMGTENQAAFRDFFVANAEADIYFTGPLGAYNAINLAPFVFEGTLSLTPPVV